MKKLISIALVLFMCVGFSSCGKNYNLSEVYENVKETFKEDFIARNPDYKVDDFMNCIEVAEDGSYLKFYYDISEDMETYKWTIEQADYYDLTKEWAELSAIYTFENKMYNDYVWESNKLIDMIGNELGLQNLLDYGYEYDEGKLYFKYTHDLNHDTMGYFNDFDDFDTYSNIISWEFKVK